jgi:hypothetical protein
VVTETAVCRDAQICVAAAQATGRCAAAKQSFGRPQAVVRRKLPARDGALVTAPGGRIS